MLHLGIMSSENSDKFGAIIQYFKSRNDIEITCISDNLKSDIFNLSKPDFVSTKYLSPENALSYFASNNFDLIAIYNYMPKLDDNIYNYGKFINLHFSLLPAFKGDNAIYRAFESGVKVSGVTIHTITSAHDNEKILAQYPVLISNVMHFDEFKQSIENIANLIYPIVIDKILQNKIFDFQDLISNKKGCSGSCGGNCGGCH